MQRPLFQYSSSSYEADEQHCSQQSVPGPEQKSGADSKEHESRVHGVTYIAVWAAAYHGVGPFPLDPHRGGEIWVFAECEIKEVEGAQKEQHSKFVKP